MRSDGTDTASLPEVCFFVHAFVCLEDLPGRIIEQHQLRNVWSQKRGYSKFPSTVHFQKGYSLQCWAERLKIGCYPLENAVHMTVTWNITSHIQRERERD